jgi:hypothetical protein
MANPDARPCAFDRAWHASSEFGPEPEHRKDLAGITSLLLLPPRPVPEGQEKPTKRDRFQSITYYLPMVSISSNSRLRSTGANPAKAISVSLGGGLQAAANTLSGMLSRASGRPGTRNAPIKSRLEKTKRSARVFDHSDGRGAGEQPSKATALTSNRRMLLAVTAMWREF